MKWRKVCCLPERNRFGPLDANNDNINHVTMTVDEYEATRYRLRGFTQEECAEQMNVARTTVQGILFKSKKNLPNSW